MTTLILPDLTDLLAQAGEAASDLALKARLAVADRVMVAGRIDRQKLDEDQHVVHGLAWIAAYAETLVQTAHWARALPVLDEASALPAQVLAFEYLSQLAGGLPMNQGEMVRPGDLGLSAHALAPLIERLRPGASQAVRLRIVALLAEAAGRPALEASGLDETLETIRDQFHAFTEAKIRPHAQSWHLKDELIPLPLIQDLADLGVFGLTAPEAYGGVGLGKVAMCVVSEALSRGWIGTGSLGTRSEIAAELMPNDEEASALLLYESAEGGAGVLSRLVESPAALRQLGRTALDVCHWRLSDPLPAIEPALEDADPECEAGCYRCLLGYHNQREHDRIDRRIPELKQFLLDLARGELVGQGGSDSRSERLERLRGFCQSGLERIWLETTFRLGHHLPDDAQKEVSGHFVTPDFTYREAGALVFIDGPHHEKPLQQRLDQQKRQALKDAGIRVVVFDQHSEEWPAVFREHAWLFGKGKGDAPAAPPAASPSGQQATPSGDGGNAQAIGEAFDAVFAQHQQLFGKGGN
jgi:hypothetical protein